MPVPLYADAHIPRAVTVALRLAGADVLTAQEDGAITLTDTDLLDRASALGRTLVTFDDDLLVEATRRQREGMSFAGVVFAHPSRISIGDCVRELVLIAQVGEPSDLADSVVFLPL